MRRRDAERPRWPRWVVGRVVLARALRLGVVVVALTPLLSACTLFGEEFDPHEPAVEAARARADAAVRARLDAVTTGRTVRASFADDGCAEGQNNWKVHDGYEWSCTLGRGALVDGATTLDEVGAHLIRLHERLVEVGCTPRGARAGLTGTALDYWERYRTRPGYGPDDLPGETYLCDDGVVVGVKPSAPGSPYLDTDTHVGFYSDRERVSEERADPGRLRDARSAPVVQLFAVSASLRYHVQ